MRLLVTWTPLRSLALRRALLRIARDVARLRRRRLEARGDRSLSRPALWNTDVRLAERLGSNGTFVEAGANDGYSQSNTYYLERFCGWRGVLIEPLPDLAGAARRERPEAQVFECALVPPEDDGRFVRILHAGLMSVVAGAQGSDEADRSWAAGAFSRGEADVRVLDVPGRTLTAILDEAGIGEITLLSLDLEGFEAPALRGLDFDRHAPQWILVEAHDHAARAAIEATLADRYVHVERFTQYDELYRRADL